MRQTLHFNSRCDERQKVKRLRNLHLDSVNRASHPTVRTSQTHFTVRFTFYYEVDAVGDYQCPSEMSVEDVSVVVKHQDTENALDRTQTGLSCIPVPV